MKINQRLSITLTADEVLDAVLAHHDLEGWRESGQHRCVVTASIVSHDQTGDLQTLKIEVIKE